MQTPITTTNKEHYPGAKGRTTPVTRFRALRFGNNNGNSTDPRKTTRNNKRFPVVSTGIVQILTGIMVMVAVGVPFWLKIPPPPKTTTTTTTTTPVATSSSTIQSSKTAIVSTCHEYRRYPRSRLYGLNSFSSETAEPDFLRDAEYIYGLKPILLTPDVDVGKLCVDQSAWESNNNNNKKNHRLPFQDGTNPGIVSTRTILRYGEPSWRMFLQQQAPQAAYLAATVFKPQPMCHWQDDTRAELDKLNFSLLTKDPFRGTVVSVLDSKLQSLLLYHHQSFPVYLERDAYLGPQFTPLQSRDNQSIRQVRFLDDPRLFLHNNNNNSNIQVWITFSFYANGIAKRQLFAPLRIEYNHNAMTTRTNGGMTVYIKASEVVPVCCGRNMAVLGVQEDDDDDDDDMDDQSHRQTRKFNNSWSWRILQFIDPVRVLEGSEIGYSITQETNQWIASDNVDKEHVDDDHRQQEQQQQQQQTKKQSYFHGNNGFMSYLPWVDEFLSIGHFHRPRKYWTTKQGTTNTITYENHYARAGHHYSHAFFTISAQPPYRLKQLSQEFLFPSKHVPNDADIIQFITSLELVKEKKKKETTDNNHTTHTMALIGYGINDCESSLVMVHLDRIWSMLQKVPTGKQVVDLLQQSTTTVTAAAGD